MDYNILIIDDDEGRYNYIQDALINPDIMGRKPYFESSKIVEPENHIQTIINYANKKELVELYFYIFKTIEEYKVDIVFIDMWLRKEEEKKTTGEKLINMLLSNNLHKKLPIIAYSRKIPDDSQLHEPEKFLGKSVRYVPMEAVSDASQARGAINGQITEKTFKSLIEDYQSREFDYNLALICALDKEYRHVEKLLNNLTDETDDEDKRYKNGYISNYTKGVILKAVARNMYGDVGDYGALNDARNILRNFKPDYIAMTGIAAGHRESVNLGDIVIVRQSFNWHQAKITEKGILNRTHPLIIDKKSYHIIHEYFIQKEKNFINNLLDKYKNKNSIEELLQAEVQSDENDKKLKHKHNGKLSLHFGVFASGSSLVADGNTADKIKEFYDKSMGLDMEIYEVFKAAYSTHKVNTRVIAIKGIVDYMDSSKGDNWHDFASYASAQTLYKLFTEYIDIG